MKRSDKTPIGKEKILLTAKKRDLFGKKVKKLRNQGLLPGNVYGEGFPSQSIVIPLKDFFHVYKKAGATQIVSLQIDKKELPVLIQNVQRHPVTDSLLHVDLRKINLEKKIATDVPVKFIGQSDAVIQNKGVFLTIAQSLLIEALPGNIPSTIEIDIAPLKELNDEIKVKDLQPKGDYLFKDDPGKVIARITQHKEEQVTPQVVAPETVEVTTEKKEEAPKEEEKPTSQKEVTPKTPAKEEKSK